MELYEHDELASDSGDEKKLEKAEKEAEKRVLKRKCEKMSKRSRKSEASSPERKRPWGADPQQHSSRWAQSSIPPRTGATRMIGPCYKCGEMGHLVATCQQTRPTSWYPFEGSTGISIVNCMSYDKVECEGKTGRGLPNTSVHQRIKDSSPGHPDDQFEPGWNDQEGISEQDEYETLQDWEGQEKGEIKGTGSKIVRPLVRYWRGQGLRAVVYLDDGIIAVEGEEAASRASEAVKDDLRKAGFVIHVEKSQWEPTRNILWLGFELDLEEGKIKVPRDKLTRLQEILENWKVEERIPAKTLASLIGKIVALSIAVGPVARLMTRSLYAVLSSRTSWFQKLTISQEAKEELSFWEEYLPRLQGQNIWQSPSAVRVVYSDASGTGYAGYTVEHGSAVAHGQWSRWEADQSSTWRELRAVGQVLQSFVHKLVYR